MRQGTIRAKVKDGVIHPLEALDLPDGYEIEVSFKSAPSAAKLSKEEKKELVRKMCGSGQGLWGTTAQEVDAYIRELRQEWE